MSTEPKPKDITTLVIIATGVLLAGGICAFYYASKNPQATTRATLADLQALEAQIRNLKKSLAELEAKQARAEPRAPIAPPAPAADPATTAQLNALAAALTAMAESQKAQQATLAQLAAKPAPAAAAPTPTAAPATAPPTPPVAATPPAPKPIAAATDSIQAAYKQAWETGQPVTLGKTLNTQTGKLEGGRTLDPAQAKVLGLASWQEWYATEEQARRAGLEEQAASERERTENTLVDLPKKPDR